MKKTLALTLAAAMTLSLAACGSSASSASSAATSTESTSTDTSAATSTAAESGTVENKDKPLVWFNRQPSNSTTGELDTEALNFNGNTYYVGFDANQGAELQGKMIADYIKAHADTIDRNGDGVIGYVLAIGDIGHNDSIARTRGVRSALGTAVEGSSGIVSDPVGTNADGSATQVQDGTIDVDGTTFAVRELASQEMKNSAGATWDAGTASNAISAWASSLGDSIDIVISNKDGVDINTGIATPDAAGNVLSSDVYYYNEDERSYYALNVAVTADNYTDFTDSTKPYGPVSNQLDATTSPEKSVWLDIYNSADNFLSATYQPLLEKYDDLLNLKIDYIGGDGQTEANITNRLGNPSAYDAFAINMVKTDNAASYTSLLNQ